jgi:hypothetical protein
MTPRKQAAKTRRLREIFRFRLPDKGLICLVAMRLTAPSTLLAAALLAATLAVPLFVGNFDESTRFGVEVSLASSATGHVQIYWDDGAGFSEPASSKELLPQGATFQTYRLALPAGSLRALRFDPIDRGGATVAIRNARIVRSNGRVVRELPVSAFQTLNQIRSRRQQLDLLEVTVAPGDDDPQLLLTFAPPLVLISTWAEHMAWWIERGGALFLVLVAVLFGLERAPALRRSAARSAHRILARPGSAIAFFSAVAVIGSAFPVVFLGKSYVSPNVGTTLLYNGFPTLPGYASTRVMNVEGSDVGAAMWAFVPYSVVQHEAMGEGELPLWNRYNSCGTPLLGQGYSMFGDPLQWIPTLADGAAWAWDLKFLIAKWLFAIALGLIALSVTRHLPAALWVSAAAPFAGFFIYRLNHPAFFSFCYAPWPLFCCLRAAQSATWRSTAAWLGGSVVANFALMNSGTVKEAYMLLLTMNFSGACVILAADAPRRARLLKLAGLAGAGGLLALISAPIWHTFLQDLRGAYTSYSQPSVFQIQPGMLLGAFDEIFFRPLNDAERVFNPAANFLVLAGVLYFLATLRHHGRAALALAASALLPLSAAFGLVPPEWIARVPFVGNIAHIDDSFGCGVIILAYVMAGAGFAAAAVRLGRPEGRGDMAVAGLLLFGLVFGFVAFGQAAHRPAFGLGLTFSPVTYGHPLPVAPFIWRYLAVLLAATAGGAWIVRRSLVRREFTPACALALAACLVALLWRQAQQSGAGHWDNYIMRPAERVDFDAPSEAVAFVRQAQRAGPVRGIGLLSNFCPGWTGVYGLEGINGPDPLINPRFRELMDLSSIQRVADWRLYLTPAALSAARPVLDFLNVRYYFDAPGGSGESGAGLKLARAADLDVYESLTAWPRAFFCDRLMIYQKPRQLMAEIARGDGRPFAAVQPSEVSAHAELGALSGRLADRKVANAYGYRLTSHTTSFEVRASGPGVVVLAESWWPGYPHATLDGREAPVLRLNHMFQGVFVGRAGPHRLVFDYRPRRFSLMLWLAAAGLAGVAASFVGIVRRPKRSDRGA